MERSLIIVDDFLDNIDQLRNLALSLDYPEDNESAYPGRNSQQRVPIQGIEEQIGFIVGEQLRPMPNTAHGKFRITLANDTGMAGVHIDPSYWSGILYLTKPENCKGGTHFYRHKATNTERAPIFPGDREKVGMAGVEDPITEILGPDTHNPAAWEETLFVPMRYNRLVLLRPWLWHNAGAGFGNSIEDGRLIQMLFFETIKLR